MRKYRPALWKKNALKGRRSGVFRNFKRELATLPGIQKKYSKKIATAIWTCSSRVKARSRNCIHKEHKILVSFRMVINVVKTSKRCSNKIGTTTGIIWARFYWDYTIEWPVRVRKWGLLSAPGQPSIGRAFIYSAHLIPADSDSVNSSAPPLGLFLRRSLWQNFCRIPVNVKSFG